VEDTAPAPGRYLPHAVAATATVTIAPAIPVWGLAATGTVTGFIPLLAVGLVVSLMVAYGGRGLWEMRPGSRDILFSDLMLWGWLRRWRLERRLGDAVALLGLDTKDLHERRDELDRTTRIKALKRLANALEARDPYTHGHSRRVARYSTMIAKRLGLPAADVAKVRLAAAVHDVGKLVVPLEILNKPSRLTDEEFEVIKRHAPVGADMIRPLGDDELTEIVAHHHERLDGSGYPSHLSGDEIPLGARIIAVADTFDALTSKRAYKPVKRHRDVFRILREESGTQLDPDAVQAFSRCYSGFWGIAAWSILSGAPQRVLIPLGAQAPVAGATLSAKALAVVAAATAAAAIATGSSLSGSGGGDANQTGALTLAATGADAGGSESGARKAKSAALPVRGEKRSGNPSKDGAGGGAGQDGGGGAPPAPDDPGALPDPGNLPRPDSPAVPGNPVGNPGRVVERQLERLPKQPVPLRKQSVPVPRPSGRLGAQSGELGRQLG
jgi:putative nucleotidyltransferase with HDIG domain